MVVVEEDTVDTMVAVVPVRIFTYAILVKGLMDVCGKVHAASVLLHIKLDAI